MKNALAGLFLATSLVAQPGFAQNQQNTTKDAMMMCFRESTGASPTERIDNEKECLAIATEYVLTSPSATNYNQMLLLRAAFMEGRDQGIKNPNTTDQSRVTMAKIYVDKNHKKLPQKEKVDLINAFTAGMTGIITKRDIDILNKAGEVKN